MNSRKFILVVGILLLFTVYGYTQSESVSFCMQCRQTNLTGMYVLGSWAIVNMASGIYGWNAFDNHSKYFHQMNFFWNTVNLSIAGISLYTNYQLDCNAISHTEIMAKHLQTEKILLVNSALDVGYIGTGLLLNHLSNKSNKRRDLLKGYGNSLLIQGSFLLVFDLAMYGILQYQRLNFLQNIQLNATTDVIGLHFIIPI
jgi:hypothetical protein